MIANHYDWDKGPLSRSTRIASTTDEADAYRGIFEEWGKRFPSTQTERFLPPPSTKMSTISHRQSALSSRSLRDGIS